MRVKTVTVSVRSPLNVDERSHVRLSGARWLRISPMNTNRLTRWLLAGCVCSTLSVAHVARAAEPPKPALPASTSGADTGDVKSPIEKKLLPAPAPVRVPALTEPDMRASLSAKPEKRILGLRLPTFIAFGLGGLSAGGAIATSFAATRGNDPSTCDSRCTEHGVRQKALLITTGVLTGMAAAGVGIGITLMIKAPKNPSRDAIRPRFDLGLSGEKAVAKVGWVFSSF